MILQLLWFYLFFEFHGFNTLIDPWWKGSIFQVKKNINGTISLSHDENYEANNSLQHQQQNRKVSKLWS